MKAALTGVAPILLVNDINVSVDYYSSTMGFSVIEIYGSPANFALIQRDNLVLMFAKAPGDLIKPNWQIVEKTCNVYFWVNDVESLYKEFIDNGAKIDYSLYTAPYGVKEFGINDPDEYDIAFGEIIK